jgi:predicted phage-related endonuclease
VKLGIAIPELDNTSAVTAFSEHAFFSGADDSDRDGWLKARQMLVTASEMPALLGIDPRRDALDVYVSKLVPSNDVYHGLNDRRTWGKALESGIATEAARAYKWYDMRMSGALLVSRELPIIGCTQDAEVHENIHEDKWCSYEGKTVEVYRAQGWDEETGTMPDHVIAQVQTQLFVTRAPKSIVTCLVGLSKLVRIDMYPDQEFFALIRDAGEDMARRLESLEPPPVSWRSGNALKLLYPQENGERVGLPKEAIDWTRELQSVTQTIKANEERREELRNCIKQAIGCASVGVLPEPVDGIAEWSNNTTERGEYTVQASSFRVLRSKKAKATRGKR